MNFTVILHRSERISKIFDADNKTDTYVASVTADNLRHAIEKAQVEVKEADLEEGDFWNLCPQPTVVDYTVLLVFEGHIAPILYGWQT